MIMERLTSMPEPRSTPRQGRVASRSGPSPAPLRHPPPARHQIAHRAQMVGRRHPPPPLRLRPRPARLPRPVRPRQRPHAALLARLLVRPHDRHRRLQLRVPPRQNLRAAPRQRSLRPPARGHPQTPGRSSKLASPNSPFCRDDGNSRIPPPPDPTIPTTQTPRPFPLGR
jgi:hypothetical protein